MLCTLYEYTQINIVPVSGAMAQSQMDLDIFSGEGPIFLTNLLCNEDDRQLFDCLLNGGSTTGNTLGLTECNHDQDIGVECIGMYRYCNMT